MTSHSDTQVDDVRGLLCRQIAAMLQAGCSRARVRIHQVAGQADRAWFYAHRDSTWHKETAELQEPAALAVLAEELDALKSRGHTDDCEVLQHHAADWTDTDFLFRREWLDQHVGPHLESYVQGILFRDPHASGKDIRRQFRTPHVGA